MTAVLDRIPVDQITAEARQVNVGRSLLALLALIPFIVGWVAAAIVTAVAWVWAAVKAGWREVRPPAKPDRSG
jgi:hypothetical protein